MSMRPTGRWGRAPSKPKQLKVLEALDHAKTQYYHVCAIWIAGMGFFTDAYDLFCISVVARLLGRIYYSDERSQMPGVLPISVYSAVTGTALCGTLTGQIFFGWLGDKLGRKSVYGITLIMMGIFSLASGLSFGHSPKAVMATLCFFRFWLGFGVGGDYPLSATIMSEYANTTTRGAFIAAVFAMQGFGILAAGAVGVILASIFNKAYPAPGPWTTHGILSTVPQADYLWRIMFMLGAFPAATTYYYRMKMPETARYTALIVGDAKKAAEDMTAVLNIPESSLIDNPEVVNVLHSPDDNETGSLTENYGLFSREFVRRHGKQLLGTASTWFLLDVVYYSQTFYQTQIFDVVGWTPRRSFMNAIEEVDKISRAQSLLALCGVVPGYWFTVILVDRIGRKVIQIQGFLFMSIFIFVIAFWYANDLERTGNKSHVTNFLVFYALQFFFANFGPNATTFIIPAEMFPARMRATCHGISASCGKAGAIVGSFGFLYASQSRSSQVRSTGYPGGIGLKYSFIVLASTCIIGALCTLLIPETKNRSLEEISEERDFSSDFEFSEHPKLHHKLQQQSDTMSPIEIHT